MTERRNGNGPSYPIPIYSGILEHYQRMGASIWTFIWCIDRIPKGAEQNGVGLVASGRPVTASEIARSLKSDERTARRQLHHLAEKRYITLKRAPQGYIVTVANSHKWNIWKRRPENPPTPEPPADNPVLSPSETPGKIAGLTGQECPTERTRVSNVTGQECPMLYKEDTAEHRRNSVETQQNGFGVFWTAYPRKEAKKSAIKAWGKINPEEYPALLAALERHKQSAQWKKDTKYIPHPASWLNGERWKDEVQTGKGNGTGNHNATDEAAQRLREKARGCSDVLAPKLLPPLQESATGTH